MAGQHKYPVYIISKGRYYNPITARYFDEHQIDYLIAVEPHEFKKYSEVIDSSKILKLPFSDLGLGSYPARNYCWEHAKKNGHKYHWLFDDNIRGFCKWQGGKKKNIHDYNEALVFVEDFVNKYNIDISGFEYRYFSANPPRKAFKINCHVYSALLIKNNLKYRWRLKYNEDVDLCLQVLHNGGITASSQLYLINKTSTVAKMKGGNQTELYKNNSYDKKLLKAKMLQKVWPQYVDVVIRFGRPHHFVDWRKHFGRK